MDQIRAQFNCIVVLDARDDYRDEPPVTRDDRDRPPGGGWRRDEPPPRERDAPPPSREDDVPPRDRDGGSWRRGGDDVRDDRARDDRPRDSAPGQFSLFPFEK